MSCSAVHGSEEQAAAKHNSGVLRITKVSYGKQLSFEQKDKMSVYNVIIITPTHMHVRVYVHVPLKANVYVASTCAIMW